MNYSRKILLTVVLLFASVFLMQSSSALILPDPTTVIDGVPVSSQHTDFYSYSLPILGYFADPKANFKLTPGNPFYVDADKDDIIIATSQGNNNPSNPWRSNIAGMDHPYDTPAANTMFAFSTGTQTDPSQLSPLMPAGADTANTWDIELSALTGYLGDSDLVFFFNHNEVGSNGNKNNDSDDDLYAWGHVKLVDLDGAKPDVDFFFADAAGIPAEFIPPDDPSWQISDIPGQYVHAPSDICIPTPWGTQCLEHNLGTSKSAYGVFSPGLNDYVKNFQTPSHSAYGYDAMQGDFRLAGLDGGYEQLFTKAGYNITVIPEPMSLFLLGSGLFGMIPFLRKKKSK